MSVVLADQPQPVVPSAPPPSYGQQQRQLDPYPPQPISTDPNTRTTTTTTTTTTYVTTRETVSYLVHVIFSAIGCKFLNGVPITYHIDEIHMNY